MFSLFGKKESSKEIAKDRLRLVLSQDRLSLAPQTMEHMKDALIEVISRYVEIDPNGIEFSWQDQERNRALVANIPVKSVRRGGFRDDRASQHSY